MRTQFNILFCLFNLFLSMSMVGGAYIHFMHGNLWIGAAHLILCCIGLCYTLDGIRMTLRGMK